MIILLKLAVLSHYSPFIMLFKQLHRIDVKCKYSKQQDIHAYIPQIKIPGYQFPVLLCNVDGVQRFVGWQNSKNPSYDNHNILFDVKTVKRNIIYKRSSSDLTNSDAKHENKTFSVVKFWEPASI